MQAAKAEIRTVARPRCFLCGTEGKVLHESLVDSSFNAPGTWVLKRCPNTACGLLWLDPFPLEEDIAFAYQTYYTHAQPAGLSNGSGKLRDVLYSIYQFLSSLPAMPLGLHREKVRLSWMFLNQLPAGRVLDVGCGDGGFLNRIRQAGWLVEGIDFDEEAIRSAKEKYGLELKKGDLKSVQFPSAWFDAIVLNHVIEHVPDPLEVFGQCHKLLRQGGRLVMATPNSMSLGHDKFQKHWRGLEPPRHLHIFSGRTLRECAQRSGFEVVRAGSSAANADIIIGASYSIRDNPDHRLPAKPAPSLSRTLKAVLMQYREHLQLRKDPDSGEEAVLVCEKKSV